MSRMIFPFCIFPGNSPCIFPVALPKMPVTVASVELAPGGAGLRPAEPSPNAAELRRCYGTAALPQRQ